MNLLHATVLGSGSPLVILHGFLGMADNWKTLGNQYAESGFEVHLVDQRNHGKSFWSEDFNYEVLAEDLKNYLQEKKINSTIILGHSMGGKTAMQFACLHPEKTKKLIVCDITPSYYPPHHETIINALNTLDLDSITSRGEADLALGEQITDYGTRQFLLKNLFWAEKGKLRFRFNLEVLTNKTEEIGEALKPNLKFIGPTLFLKGDRSNYITDQKYTDGLHQFPSATLEIIENAGHWLHAENPKDFFEKTIHFMKS